jgi:hypothetical protein
VPQGLDAVEATGYPAILRPSFTLGGTGGGGGQAFDDVRTQVGGKLDFRRRGETVERDGEATRGRTFRDLVCLSPILDECQIRVRYCPGHYKPLG